MIYLDYASTSWPKPPAVLEAMTSFLAESGGNPGRSGHCLSLAAGRIVDAARGAVAALFNAPVTERVVFTPNVTYALNIAMMAILRPSDRVVVSGLEHNAVLRPLWEMEKHGLDLRIVPCRRDGTMDLDAFREACTPGTRLVVSTHASNVMGTILPVQEMAAIAHEAGALFLLDSAQTAGSLPLDMKGLGVDLLGFTGHKSLHGPPGTGGLIIGDRVNPDDLQPVFAGGTGGGSLRNEQPRGLPEMFEYGTPNGVGIAGLGAAIAHITSRGIASIREHEIQLADRLYKGLAAIEGVTVYGPPDAKARTATASINLAGRRASDVGASLDETYGILTRPGLHCAPEAHRSLGTFPEGTLRLAPGMSTTMDEVEQALAAVAEIAAS